MEAANLFYKNFHYFVFWQWTPLALMNLSDRSVIKGNLVSQTVLGFPLYFVERLIEPIAFFLCLVDAALKSSRKT